MRFNFKKNIICLKVGNYNFNNVDNNKQLVIIDYKGNILFDKSFSTTKNRILNSVSILHYKNQIEDILSKSDLVIGYNLLKEDLPLLDNWGIDTHVIQDVEDIMLFHSKRYPNAVKNPLRRSLRDDAETYGYYQFTENNPESDCFLILNIYKRLTGKYTKQPNYLKKLKNKAISKR